MLDKVNKLRLELGIKPAPPTALQALQQYSEAVSKLDSLAVEILTKVLLPYFCNNNREKPYFAK